METTMPITEEKLVEDLVMTMNELPKEDQFKLLYIAQGMRLASDIKTGGEILWQQ